VEITLAETTGADGDEELAAADGTPVIVDERRLIHSEQPATKPRAHDLDDQSEIETLVSACRRYRPTFKNGLGVGCG
jgi:hypothetical protein